LLTNPPEPAELERARRRHDEVVERAHRLRRRQLGTRVAAALVVVALAVSIPLGLTQSSHPGKRVVTTAPTPTVCSVDCTPTTTSVTSTSTAPTETTAAPAAPLLARGKEAPRSAIPWTQVGPGWTLAVWSPSPSTQPGDDAPDPQANAAQTLFLTNPIGGRYVEASLPAGTPQNLVDWSASGRVALLSTKDPTPVGSVSAADLLVLDLVGGKTSTSHITGISGQDDVGLTRPSGRAILANQVPASSQSGDASLVRLGLDGAHQLTFPATFAQVGSYVGSWLSASDGTRLALGASAGIALVGNDGRVIRELPVPAVDSTGCAPLRWWTPDVILVRCFTRLWLVPTSGGGPTALTAPVSDNGPDTADLDAWRVGAATFVQDAGACGYRYLARLGADGTTTPLPVPGVDSETSVFVLGTDGTRLEVFTTIACGGGQSVLWFDPATNTTDVILGPGINGGGVTVALAYPES
jgi:hypothetical protein